MGKGLSFTVIGPMNPEVLALQKAHDTFLEKAAAKGKETEAALAAFTIIPSRIFRVWLC